MKQVLGWEVHPDDLDPAVQTAAVLKAGGTTHSQVRVRCADGSYTWVAVSARPIRDETGTVIGRVAGWRDATAEAAAQSALQASEQHYRLLAENASDVVIKTGADGCISAGSPRR